MEDSGGGGGGHTHINPPAWPDYTPPYMIEGDTASQRVTLGVFPVLYFILLRNLSLLNATWPAREWRNSIILKQIYPDLTASD